MKILGLDLKWLNLKSIIEICIMIVFISIAVGSISRCSSYREQYRDMEYNASVLDDSLKTYKAKNGELVSQASLLKGDMNTLKLLNEDLYQKLENMRLKNIELAAQIEGLIEDQPKDTIWGLDTVYFQTPIEKRFSFVNQYRQLEGSVYAYDNNMQLNIDKDIFLFSYTFAVENGQIYMYSDNPYVQFDKATGIQYSQPKKKRWNIGFQAGIGINYDIIKENVGLGPYIGVGVSWGFGF